MRLRSTNCRYHRDDNHQHRYQETKQLQEYYDQSPHQALDQYMSMHHILSFDTLAHRTIFDYKVMKSDNEVD